MSLDQAIKTAKLASHSPLSYAGNKPNAFQGRQKQYGADATKAYNQLNAKYATDYFLASVQALTGDFDTYVDTYIRISDLLPKSATGNLFDDWKSIYFQDPKIEWISAGAKILVGQGDYQQTYIVYNPQNVSSVTANCIARRANATYNYFDFYGNVIREALVFDEGRMLATSTYYQEYQALMSGYQHSIMQYNEKTRNVTNNTRMILGNQAYKVRGLVNFAREFTADSDSVHLMTFDLAIDEPTANDDMVNFVADGLAFSFTVSCSGNPNMSTGSTQTLSAVSTRNGEVVTSTLAQPISYTWSTSNALVATVNGSGVVTSVGTGSCTVTCTLNQNASVFGTFDIAVSSPVSSDYVSFGQVPQSISTFDSTTISATYYENGIATADAVTFSFSGANESSYSTNVVGNNATISAWQPDDNLVVTATAHGYTASVSIALIGY